MVGGRRRLTALAVLVEVVDDRALLEQLRGSPTSIGPAEQVVDRAAVGADGARAAFDPQMTHSLGVAQLAERSFRVRETAGSNPAAQTNRDRSIGGKS